MSVLLQEDSQSPLSTVHKVRQVFPRQKTDDVAGTIKEQLSKPEILPKIRPGAKVAVAMGSRGIRGLSVIVKSVLEGVQAAENDPFIVPVTGSHDSGTSEGQREVLGIYGITPESMGVPATTDVGVELLGTTGRGIQVYFDKTAPHADLIVSTNRIKLHTDFMADIQSDLYKMLVIGLGGHKGCIAIHEDDLDHFGNTLLKAAEIILKKVSVRFGMGIVEGTYDETALVETIPVGTLVSREKELVEISRSGIPNLMTPGIDLLIVEEIDKNISGARCDPGVFGKNRVLKGFVLGVSRINRVILPGATEQSHGNAVGTGIFGAIARKIFGQLDLEATYANSVAIKRIDDAKIPLITTDEERAIHIVIKIMRGVGKDHLHIIKVENALELETTGVSDVLLDYVAKHKRLPLL